ncbi:hypothetical protein SLS62_008070 [Diatrype stigma]|uniref:Kelch repeat-containing protein n=1 Tax=Diatrype stigma TaxID=117547 RepID=A0AAN9YMW5_9PEZI
MNTSEIFETISKAPNGNAATNFAPNYYDGAMLANDHEFFLYGGLLRRTDVFSPPDADAVLAYQISQYGTPKPDFHPGFAQNELPDGLTRYITFGGAANAPSENKGWYFGGMHAPGWGPVYYPSANESINPTNTSNTLITLDMSVQYEEKWANATLPEEIKGRADPAVVWVPVSEQGILVVLGGVSYPDYNNPTADSQNAAQSQKESPIFMSTIDIYDIARDKWYQQPTIGGPSQLTQGCAVVAVAQDYSSYNIYYYGGYDGINADGDYNDDVWILSLPSFMWMKVSSGSAEHGRAGHKCVMPYPDQMVVIGGGATAKTGNGINCVEENIMLNFNLTEGKWLDAYDPDVWANYGVPQMIHLMIGGDYSGGATMTTPTPTGWADDELAAVFATPYETSKLKTYFPYTAESNDSSRENSESSERGLPPWVPPVLGVILGLVFITAIVVAILLYRRRRLLKGGINGRINSHSDEQGHRIISWIRGQSNSDKAATVTTDDTPPLQSDDMESRVQGTPVRSPEMVHHRQVPFEMADTQLVELMDTSPRVELGDTALTPVQIIDKHTHFGSNPHTPRSTTTPTHPSASWHNTAGGSGSMSVSQPDHASSFVSSQHQHTGSTGLPAPPQAHQVRGSFDSQSQYRPDSPALGSVSNNNNNNNNSGGESPVVAPSTPRQRGFDPHDHFRKMSNGSGTVSQPGSPGFAHTQVVGGQPPPGSPLVSPPSPSLGQAAPDYVSVQNRNLITGQQQQGSGSNSSVGGGGNNRRSMFHENPDDLGEQRR